MITNSDNISSVFYQQISV